MDLFVLEKPQELNISHRGEIFGKEKFPSIASVQNQQVLLLGKDVCTLPPIGSGEIQAQGTWEGRYHRSHYPNITFQD